MHQIVHLVLVLFLVGCAIPSSEVFGSGRWEVYADNECGASAVSAMSDQELRARFEEWMKLNPRNEIVEWQVFFGPSTIAASTSLNNHVAEIRKKAHRAVRGGYNPFSQGYDLPAMAPAPNIQLGGVFVYCPRITT